MVNPADRIPSSGRTVWFQERYEDAANQVVEFFGAEFFSLTGKVVADIGCGDGIMDLGIFHKVAPAHLVGFDLGRVDTVRLSSMAAEYGQGAELPDGLEFRTAPAEHLGAPDGTFDYVFSWSAFHHLADPLGALREIRRVLRASGALMIQIYPLFDSAHGSLLEEWFPEGFAQFVLSDEQIAQQVLGTDPSWGRLVLEASGGLNRLSLDSLGEMLVTSGFRVIRLELIAEETRVPPEVAGRPLSRLGIGGVKLLAVPV